MPVFEVPVVVGVLAESRDEAESVAGDIADSLAEMYDSVESATALILTNDDDFDRLRIKRGGVE